MTQFTNSFLGLSLFKWHLSGVITDWKERVYTYTIGLLCQAIVNRLRMAPLPPTADSYGHYRTVGLAPEAGVQGW